MSSWWKLPWWAVVTMAVFFGFALFGERGVLRVMEVSLHGDQLRQEIAKLTANNHRLEKDIRNLRSDRRFIEDIARRDLCMARDNEIIYIFPPKRYFPRQ